MLNDLALPLPDSITPGARDSTGHRVNHADPSTLVGIDRHISAPLNEVVIGQGTLGAREVLAVARQDAAVRFTDDPEVLRRVADSYERMMRDVVEGVPVYGCNTGYGGQAARVVVPGSRSTRVWVARSISEAIAAIDVSVGPPFGRDVVRAGILLRMNMLMRGVSAVKLADLDFLRRLLNLGLTPRARRIAGRRASGRD